MTTTDKDPHPEVAEISDLAEGILPAERAADLREHLAGCALCADVRDSLEEIRGLLGTLPGPQRMPADIAGRIDAALAAEALLDANRPDVPRGTPVAVDVPRGTSGGPGAPGGADAPRGHASGSTGPGRPGRTRRRWTGVLLTAASVAAVGLIGVALYQAGDGNGVSNDSATGSKMLDSGAAGDTVQQQVRQLLTAVPAAGGVESPMLNGQGGGDDTKTPHSAAGAVPACVLKATQRTDAPLAAEREPFQGKDAYLVVLPHPGTTVSVDAFVVSAACTATSPGAVLFRDTYPR